jgi:hypothetical protein
VKRSTIALVVFLVVLGIVAGLYATGPKYVYQCPHGRYEILYRDDGKAICHHLSGGGTFASLHRTSAWERVKYAVIGSDDARG